MTEASDGGPGPGHGLLAGKNVLVTAAAGTGIGFATAERCLAEGARVVVSDAHERRLAEAAEELGGGVAAALPCDVTVEEQVQALFGGAAAARRRPSARSTSWSTTPASAAPRTWST